MPFHEFMDPIPPVHPVEADAWKSTYRAPSVVQEQLAQTLNSCRTGLTSLGEEEKSLIARLKAISEAKSELYLRVPKLEAAIASHRKLPPELLSQIFELTRDDELHLPPQDPRTMAFKPLRTQQTRKCRPEHVCSLWRRVAQETPYLNRDVWQVVKISYGKLGGIEDAAQFPSSILDLASFSRGIIARGTQTLHIDFGAWITGQRDDLVTLWIPDDELLDLTIERGAPHLESITIDNGDLSQPFLDASAELLTSFPRLTSVTLQYSIDYDWMRSFPLHQYPLHNLTELKAFPTNQDPAVISSDGFYQILRSLPRLETCFLHLSCNDRLPTAYELAQENFVHDLLKRISIRRQYCECIGGSSSCGQVLAPFEHLSLPSLRSFEISAQQNSEPSFSHTLFEFITRSQCELETFRLETHCSKRQDKVPFPQSQWEALAPYLVNLTSLFAPCMVLPAGIPREIAQGRHLPHLKYLHCQIFEVDQHYRAMLCELMNSRHAGERCWRESYISVIPEEVQVSLE